MHKTKSILHMIVFSIFILSIVQIFAQDSNSIDIVKKVTDKIIRDSSFKFKLVPNKPNKSVQIVDFRMEYGNYTNSVAYAFTNIISEKDTTIEFGLSSSGPIKIWVNDKLSFEKNEDFVKEFRIVAYDFFEFPYHANIALKKGVNSCLVKLGSSDNDWIFNMTAINEEGELYRPVAYSLKPINELEINSNWLVTGPFTIPASEVNSDILYR